MTTTQHHVINFGESLRWVPSDGVSQFFVWGKSDRFDNSIMRWKRVAGYNVRDRHASHGPGIVGQHLDTERPDRYDLERPVDRVRRF